ncbi:MAG: response regulator, partial [Candidatus Eisenbacteria bacterium]|nr:response regulator [Candidatus Eisenbacteria bacterium]
MQQPSVEESWALEMPRLLVVDDEEPLLEIFVEFFEGSEYQLTIAKTGEEAMELLDQQEFDLVVTDLNLPGADGLCVLGHAKRVDPEIEVIVLTGNASTLTAIDALRQGAYDYVLKPFDLFEMEQTVSKALERRRLLSENRRFVTSLQKHRDELSRLVDEATWRMRTLYEVGKEITATLDLDRTLNLILEKSVELTRAGRGLLFLLDESHEIHCRVSRGIADSDEAEPLWAEVLHPTNAKVVADKRAVLAEIDVPGEARAVAWVVPLLQEQIVVGTIAVLAAEEGTFSQDDRDLLVGLASQATISIHNARVYEKIQALDKMKS